MAANPTVGGDTNTWGPKLNAVLDENRTAAARATQAITAQGTAPFKVFRQADDPVTTGLVEDGDWWVRIP